CCASEDSDSKQRPHSTFAQHRRRGQGRQTPTRKGTPMTKVNVVIGPGSIGEAIARRVSAGRHVVLADLRQEHAAAAAKTFSEAGFDATTTTVDVSNRASVEALVEKARALGEVHGL